VKYPLRVSVLAFFGGAIFGLGTRLAQGCTTWHYLGGIPAMSLTSIVVALVSVPFAFLAFYLMSKMGVSGFLKHQEAKATVLKSVELGHKTDTLGYDASYKPYKDPLRLILMAFLFAVLISSFWTAFQGVSDNSIGRLPVLDIFLMTLAGFMLGFGIAKSGFGTECAVMAPHSLHMKPKHFESLGVARIARTMFTGLMPFVGLIIAVLMLNIAILVTWIGFGWPIPIVVEAGAYKWGFHLGHLVGGPLLGVGSVLMLGCEIRTYARTGMGYMTGLAALPGFFFGYLPYTLYQKQFDKVFFDTGFIREKNILELLPNTPFIQYGFAFLYTAVLIALVIWGIRKGSQMVKITTTEYVTMSVDDIFIKGLKGISKR
ncbi:MAG: YeeE/YedE thiosulfate transporter family protein, partial [Pseudomonadota bacterium]